MTEETPGYILTEIWNARQSWLALSPDERQRFFEEKIGPFIGSMVESGAEILGCAINNNDGAERIDYQYMAIWRLPDKAFSDRLEAGAKERGFLEYFDQANFSGVAISAPVMNADMIKLGT
jgi:hypothetical protein